MDVISSLDGEFVNLGLISLGAEAAIYGVEWRGLELVAKVRLPKPYRHPELDKEVRSKRTLNEVKVMVRSREAGVSCPAVVHVDLVEFAIFMERIRGLDLREVLATNPEEALRVAKRIGEMLALMHESDIYHGDPVPSNVIIRRDEPFLIDFGLSGFSKDVEEQATDLNLVERSVASGFSSAASEFVELLYEGYESVRGETSTREVRERVAEIRKRARYVMR